MGVRRCRRRAVQPCLVADPVTAPDPTSTAGVFVYVAAPVALAVVAAAAAFIRKKRREDDK